RERVSRAADERGLRPLHCVLVDESQFLEPLQIDQLFRIAKQDAISVICYGLRTDFRTTTFPGAQRLFELADNVEKLPTMCRCGAQAEFNCRRVGERGGGGHGGLADRWRGGHCCVGAERRGGGCVLR